MPHYYPIVLQGGKSLAGDSLGFHAYSLRIDNLSNQWLLEETSLAWIPPYSLGTCLRLYGTGVAILLNQAPVGQPQLAPVVGEQTVGVYSDQLRTEVAGTPVRQFTLVQSVSDLTQGTQPPNPPVGVDRLWADSAGNIHHLHTNGTDLTLVDPSNAGTLLYPSFDPHYQALMSATAVGGDASGTVANITNLRARGAFSIGGLLTMPILQSGPVATIVWPDGGAGYTEIVGNTVGGVPGACILRFDVANGNSAGTLTTLTLDGTGTATVTYGLSIANLAPGGLAAIRLPAQSGGLTPAIQWADAGAGITRIMGNTVGGVPQSCVLRFDLATGIAGLSITALQLDGRGSAIIAQSGDAFCGTPNNGATATTGFLYFPSGGGTQTGVPASNGLGWIATRFYPPGNALQAYLNGTWKSITFT